MGRLREQLIEKHINVYDEPTDTFVGLFVWIVAPDEADEDFVLEPHYREEIGCACVFSWTTKYDRRMGWVSIARHEWGCPGAKTARAELKDPSRSV